MADQLAKMRVFRRQAIRKYDALELKIDKRFAKNYYFNANSRLAA